MAQLKFEAHNNRLVPQSDTAVLEILHLYKSIFDLGALHVTGVRSGAPASSLGVHHDSVR